MNSTQVLFDRPLVQYMSLALRYNDRSSLLRKKGTLLSVRAIPSPTQSRESCDLSKTSFDYAFDPVSEVKLEFDFSIKAEPQSREKNHKSQNLNRSPVRNPKAS